jgi:hypothetical protein
MITVVVVMLAVGLVVVVAMPVLNVDGNMTLSLSSVAGSTLLCQRRRQYHHHHQQQ